MTKRKQEPGFASNKPIDQQRDEPTPRDGTPGARGTYGQAQPLDQGPPSGSTEPRQGTRIGEHSSQGIEGAQGSGGGAERGVNQPPPRKRDSGRP